MSKNAKVDKLEKALAEEQYRTIQLEARIREMTTNWYMTRSMFMNGYTAALEEYLSHNFKDGQTYHPEDLAYAVASFNDAFLAIYTNTKFGPQEPTG